MRLCRESGVPDIAEKLVEAGATLETVTATVASEKDSRAKAAQAAAAAAAAAERRSADITALCATAKLPELAAGYIKGGMDITDVQAHLVTVTAKLDAVEIDGGLNPDRTPDTKSSWKTAFARVKRVGLTH